MHFLYPLLLNEFFQNNPNWFWDLSTPPSPPPPLPVALTSTHGFLYIWSSTEWNWGLHTTYRPKKSLRRASTTLNPGVITSGLGKTRTTKLTISSTQHSPLRHLRSDYLFQFQSACKNDCWHGPPRTWPLLDLCRTYEVYFAILHNGQSQEGNLGS